MRIVKTFLSLSFICMPLSGTWATDRIEEKIVDTISYHSLFSKGAEEQQGWETDKSYGARRVVDQAAKEVHRYAVQFSAQRFQDLSPLDRYRLSFLNQQVWRLSENLLTACEWARDLSQPKK